MFAGLCGLTNICLPACVDLRTDVCRLVWTVRTRLPACVDYMIRCLPACVDCANRCLPACVDCTNRCLPACTDYTNRCLLACVAAFTTLKLRNDTALADYVM
jgi:hypothetical protein